MNMNDRKSCQTCLMALVEICIFGPPKNWVLDPIFWGARKIANACTKPVGASDADAICGTLSGHVDGESVVYTGLCTSDAGTVCLVVL